MVGNLLSALQKEMVTSELDMVSWLGAAGERFSMRETYKVLQPRTTSLFPSKGVWVPSVPTKSAFYSWEATWGKVLTLDQLQRSRWQLPNRCYLCGCAEESVHHILLHCSVVSSLWTIILALVGVNWVFPKTIKEALLSWRGSFVGRKRKKIWNVVPLCIF